MNKGFYDASTPVLCRYLELNQSTVSVFTDLERRQSFLTLFGSHLRTFVVQPSALEFLLTQDHRSGTQSPGDDHEPEEDTIDDLQQPIDRVYKILNDAVSDIVACASGITKFR